MADQIIIRNLEIYSNHGVYKEEKVLGQKFLVSAILDTDTKRAGISDCIDFSVDYGKVCHRIAEIMENNTFDLLERVAETLAKTLLLEFPLVKKLEIQVKKPWAPIGIPLDSVAVKISRGWHRAYIGTGSNMGDRKAYLDQAVRALDDREDSRVEKVSGFIETPPYGVTDQADFLNGCLKLKTLLYPGELLEELGRIEKDAGRERIIHWGPRTLDLDIIFYDDLVWEEDELCIPHVEMHKRRFVLEPLSEIAPYKRHPVYGKTVKEMLAELAE